MVELDKRLKSNLDELLKLYDVTEAEGHLISQLSVMLQMLGVSRKLMIKLLNVLVRALEMIQDEEDRVERNKK